MSGLNQRTPCRFLPRSPNIAGSDLRSPMPTCPCGTGRAFQIFKKDARTPENFTWLRAGLALRALGQKEIESAISNILKSHSDINGISCLFTQCEAQMTNARREIRLVLRAQCGDCEALEELLRTIQSDLLGHIGRLMGRSNAEGVLHISADLPQGEMAS